MEKLRQLNALATERGQTLAEMALAWVLRPGVARYETLFSSLGRPEGVAVIAEGMSGEVQEHAYWGGMRDRIPLSQTDEMAPGGKPSLRLRHIPSTFGVVERFRNAPTNRRPGAGPGRAACRSRP